MIQMRLKFTFWWFMLDFCCDLEESSAGFIWLFESSLEIEFTRLRTKSGVDVPESTWFGMWWAIEAIEFDPEDEDEHPVLDNNFLILAI